jgi:hypothetical protein
MKRLLLSFILLFGLYGHTSYAQITFPTNREIYNFSVGDTFIYQYYRYNPNCPLMYIYQCSYDYCIIVTGKRFSTDSNTVFYTYSHYGFDLYDSIPNLDSAVILPPYPNYTTNGLDTAYTDTTHYCIPRLIAYSENRYGLSDFFNKTYVSGLGVVGDSYFADQGSSPASDYGLSLIYYHKDSLVCGSYDSSKLINSISTITNPTSPISVYPNPSTGSFYFSGLTEGSRIEVYDMMGQSATSPPALSKGEGANSQVIDLSGRAKGIYFYRVMDHGNTIGQGKMVLE